MSYDVIVTEPFEIKLKQLIKKHLSLSKDLLALIEELEKNPLIGKPLGNDCYKIRHPSLLKIKEKAVVQE